jgi:hypothetical protein
MGIVPEIIKGSHMRAERVNSPVEIVYFPLINMGTIYSYESYL